MAWHKITCRQCEKKFSSTSPWAKLCGSCKRVNKRAIDRRHNGIGQGRKMMTKHEKPKPAPQSTTKRETLLNERQRRLDAALDARMYAECATSPVRVIRPGDPEFDAIARTVTPLERIPEASTLPMVTLIGREYLPNGGFPLR